MTSEEFDQPIHQVLSNYELLEVAACEDVRFSLDQPLSWRMNLCAISQHYPTKYFIAVNNQIFVYGLASSLVFTPQPIMVLKPSTNAEFMINAIKLGPMKLKSTNTTTDEILIAVSENGETFAWNTHTLFSTTTTTTNNTPFFHRYINSDNNNDDDDPSTWGIAMYMNGLIAVSSNNHRITIYNLWTTTSPQQQLNSLGQRSHIILAGHTHNIPCIDFDSSGRYLASGSIDMTCRIWDLTTLQQVGQRLMTQSQDSNAWLWGVKFIPIGQFKSTTCHHTNLFKRFQRQLDQGRATNTTDLHMEHSARAPIYQLDMHQMFHRLRTGDMTDDDEDSMDGTTTMNQLLRLRRIIAERLGQVENLEEDDDDGNDNETAATIVDTPPLQLQGDEDDAADMDLLDWEEDAMQGGGQDESWGSHSGGDDDDDDDDDIDDQGMSVWLDDDALGQHMDDEEFATSSNGIDNGDEWGDPLNDNEPELDDVTWNTNQREDYDDLLAEEEGWMQDRAQFPWHWIGVRNGNDPDQQPTSIFQDDDTMATTSAAAAAAATATTTKTSDVIVLAPPSTGNIPYVFQPTQQIKPKPTPTDYLMLTNKKDAYLLHPNYDMTNNDQQWNLPTIQRERGIVSRADARTAFVLDMMERLCFVEWIPDLELCVVASQKGCVALIRMIQVEWPNQQQSCLFNHEYYLPLNGLQNSVLYGMTIHRLPSEQQHPVYQLFLLYLDGTMRSYRISKKPSRHSLVDLVSLL